MNLRSLWGSEKIKVGKNHQFHFQGSLSCWCSLKWPEVLEHNETFVRRKRPTLFRSRNYIHYIHFSSNKRTFVISLNGVKLKTSFKTLCFFLMLQYFGNVFENPSMSMFWEMFFKPQDIVSTMHRTMFIAHPKLQRVVYLISSKPHSIWKLEGKELAESLPMLAKVSIKTLSSWPFPRPTS